MVRKAMRWRLSSYLGPVDTVGLGPGLHFHQVVTPTKHGRASSRCTWARDGPGPCPSCPFGSWQPLSTPRRTHLHCIVLATNVVLEPNGYAGVQSCLGPELITAHKKKAFLDDTVPLQQPVVGLCQMVGCTEWASRGSGAGHCCSH